MLTSPICPLGLGIGIVALQRIGRTGRRGRGIAITGILLSSLFLAAAVLTLGTFALDGTFARMAEKPQAGDFTSTRTISPINLDVGNCVLTLPVTGEVGEVTGTPCAEEHQVQVTARVPIPDADRPSEEALFTRAEQTCREVFDGLSPNTASWPQSFSPWWLIPSEANWEAGDRNIICLARSTAGPITEDVVGE